MKFKVKSAEFNGMDHVNHHRPNHTADLMPAQPLVGSRTWKEAGVGLVLTGAVVAVISQVAGLDYTLLIPQIFVVAGLLMFEPHRRLPGALETKGVVSRHVRTRSSSSSGSGSSTVWVEYYEYEFDGEVVEFRRPGTASWKSAVGTPVRVSYLPTHPSQARRIGGLKGLSFAALFVVVGAGFAIRVHPVAGFASVALVFGAYLILRFRWARRLPSAHSPSAIGAEFDAPTSIDVVDGSGIPSATVANRGF